MKFSSSERRFTEGHYLSRRKIKKEIQGNKRLRLLLRWPQPLKCLLKTLERRAATKWYDWALNEACEEGGKGSLKVGLRSTSHPYPNKIFHKMCWERSSLKPSFIAVLTHFRGNSPLLFLISKVSILLTIPQVFKEALIKSQKDFS